MRRDGRFQSPFFGDVFWAAELLNTTPKTVREMLKDGRIVGKKIGYNWLVNKAALLEQLGLTEDMLGAAVV